MKRFLLFAGISLMGSLSLANDISCSGLVKATEKGKIDTILMADVTIKEVGTVNSDQRLITIRIGDFESVSLVDDSNSVGNSAVAFKGKSDIFKADIKLTDVAIAGKAEVFNLDRVFDLKMTVKKDSGKEASTVSGMLACK